MTFTFAQQQAYAARIRATYDAAVTRMLEITARRLERGITADGWAEQKLREVQAYQQQIAQELEQLRLQFPEIADTMGTAYDAGYETGGRELARAGITDIAVDLTDAQKLGLRTITARLTSQLDDGLVQVLRSTPDAYRRIIGEVGSVMQTGVITRKQAAQQALDAFADAGITGFTDVSGRNWDLASYAEMAVRTGTGNAVRQGRFDKFIANDKDLVMVSDSPEECGLCRPWEGKVLSISGNTPGYQSVAEATAAGLFHANCTHATALYTPGLTRPLEATKNEAGYEERQRQRYLERGIRRWKQRNAVAITPEAQAKARYQVREWQGRMRTFIEETDRLRQRGRESITAAR